MRFIWRMRFADSAALSLCRAKIDGRKAGRFNIAVQYLDLRGGVAHFTLGINSTEIVSWAADALFPSNHAGDTSTRFTARGPDGRGIELKPGDVLRVEGAPDASDPAALDYIEIEPNAADAGYSATKVP